MPKAPHISLDDLRQRFHMPLAEVAKEYGVCLTYIKKLCRQYNITRWPYRKIRSLQTKADKLAEIKACAAATAVQKYISVLQEQTGTVEMLKNLGVPTNPEAEPSLQLPPNGAGPSLTGDDTTTAPPSLLSSLQYRQEDASSALAMMQQMGSGDGVLGKRVRGEDCGQDELLQEARRMQRLQQVYQVGVASSDAANKTSSAEVLKAAMSTMSTSAAHNVERGREALDPSIEAAMASYIDSMQSPLADNAGASSSVPRTLSLPVDAPQPHGEAPPSSELQCNSPISLSQEFITDRSAAELP